MATCLVLLPGASRAQSGSELRRLFFDPVYLTDDAKILSSSSGRFSEQIPASATPDTADETAARELPDLLNDIEDYESSINRLIEEGGTFDQGLAQQYLALGNARGQSGDFEGAVASYEQAMHVHRINEGLFTLSQADAVRRLIDTHKQTGNFGDADKYHEYLYFLLSRNLEPGSDELRQASLDWANWNMEAFRRMAFSQEDGLSVSGDISSVPAGMLRRGEMVAIVDNVSGEVLFVPRTVLLSGTGNLRIQSYTPEQMVDPRLRIAGDLYDELLEDNDDDEDIIKKKANILYMFKNQLEKYINVDTLSSPLTSSRSSIMRSISYLRRGYGDNRESLEELATALESQSPREAAKAWVDLGDWDLVFDRYQRAEASYAKAFDLLTGDGLTAGEASAFITPEPAIFAPEFVSYEFTRRFQNLTETQDIPYRGFIDVSFGKRENGSLRDIEILDASEDTSQAIRSRLMDLLREVRVRPLIQNGERIEQRDIKVRYYYSY